MATYSSSYICRLHMNLSPCGIIKNSWTCDQGMICDAWYQTGRGRRSPGWQSRVSRSSRLFNSSQKNGGLTSRIHLKTLRIKTLDATKRVPAASRCAAKGPDKTYWRHIAFRWLDSLPGLINSIQSFNVWRLDLTAQNNMAAWSRVSRHTCCRWWAASRVSVQSQAEQREREERWGVRWGWNDSGDRKIINF